MSKILVTGANGFIGTALCEYLIEFSCQVRGLIHKPVRECSGFECLLFDLTQLHDLGPVFKDIDCIVHLAGRAHVINGRRCNELELLRRINSHGSLHLAHQAARAGVKRFIFLSSIGVNGAITQDQPFNEIIPPSPHADYAVSKLEAEEGLRKLSEETAMEVVIIRPPLVYGPNAPGNFGRLLSLVKKEIPLPFGLIKNRRSYIARENLVSFIHKCIEHPKAANQTFVIADGEDISTTHLIRLLAEGMGCPARLFPVPGALLELGAYILGRQAMYQQLCGSLQVDISKAQKLLGWKPMVSVEGALRKAAQDFLERGGR